MFLIFILIGYFGFFNDACATAPESVKVDDKMSLPNLIVQVGNANVNKLAISPNSKLLATSDNYKIIIWDIFSQKILRKLYPYEEEIVSIAFTPDENGLITLGSDNIIKLWDLFSGKLLNSCSLAISKDDPEYFKIDRKFIFCRSGMVFLNSGYRITFPELEVLEDLKYSEIWPIKEDYAIFVDRKNKSLVHISLEDGEKEILNKKILFKNMTFSRSHDLWSFNDDGKNVVLNLATNKKFAHPNGKFYLPDTQQIYGFETTDSQLFIYNSAGKVIFSIKPSFSGGEFTSVQFSQDGNYLHLVESEPGEFSSQIIFSIYDLSKKERIFLNKDFTNLGSLLPDSKGIYFSGDNSVFFFDYKLKTISKKFSSDVDVVIPNSIKYDPLRKTLYIGTLNSSPVLVNLDGPISYIGDQKLQKYHEYSCLSPSKSKLLSISSMFMTKEDGIKFEIFDTTSLNVISRFNIQLPNANYITRAIFDKNEKFLFVHSWMQGAAISQPILSIFDVPAGKMIHQSNSLKFIVGNNNLYVSDDEGKTLAEREFLPGKGISLDMSSLKTSSEVPKIPGRTALYSELLNNYIISENNKLKAVSPSGKTLMEAVIPDDIFFDFVNPSKGHFFGELESSQITLDDVNCLIFVKSENRVAVYDLRTFSLKQKFSFDSVISDFSIQAISNSIFVCANKEGKIVFNDINSGKIIATLVLFQGGNWIVSNPQGYFDTKNLEEKIGVHWIVPKEPFTPFATEIFMKDFFEPRLLSRILNGEQFEVKNLSLINRLQPQIDILGIISDKSLPDVVSVKVKAKNITQSKKGFSDNPLHQSGVYDLALFRDGQLVAYTPENGGEIKVDPQSQETVITFNGIKIPHKNGLKEVEFSAYAFNANGIKSQTSRMKYKLPKELPLRKGNAYIISIGVNAYENPKNDLQFAVNDAQAINKTLQEKLGLQKGKYNEIIPILITSDLQWDNGKRVVTIDNATKANIKAVLGALSGKIITPRYENSTISTIFSKYSGKDAAEDKPTGIVNFDKLKPATPEDFVIISFSSHGYVDKNGIFYILQSDSGVGNTQAEMVSKSINSNELTLWLRDIDAGEMVMVIDACHSAASVQGDGFKPGPMGSRGLGQLAYNKGMKILTSTNSNDVALESEDVKHGYLTYALVQEGLARNMADFLPKDNKVTFVEWFKYGAQRVPKLHAEIKSGTFDKQSGTATKTRAIQLSQEPSEKKSVKDGGLQQPNLFDFTKVKNEEILYNVQ